MITPLNDYISLKEALHLIFLNKKASYQLALFIKYFTEPRDYNSAIASDRSNQLAQYLLSFACFYLASAGI